MKEEIVVLIKYRVEQAKLFIAQTKKILAEEIEQGIQ